MSLTIQTDGQVKRYYPAFGETLPPSALQHPKPKPFPFKFVIATLLTASITRRIPFINRIKAAAFAVFATFSLLAYLQSTRYRRRLDYNLPPAPLLGKWREGHDVIISSNVEETFQWKKRLIQSAKRSIELSPNYAGGHRWRELLALIQAQMISEPALITHLIISEDLLMPEDVSMLKKLAASYPARFHNLVTNACYSYEPEVSYHMQENHVKLLVVDGKYFAMGGSGLHNRFIQQQPVQPEESETLSSKALPLCSRDTDVIGSGPLVPIMRTEFFKLFSIWEERMKGSAALNRFFPTDASLTICKPFEDSESKIPGVKMKFLVSGPEHMENNPITGEAARRIRKAAIRILLGQYMFNPDVQIRNALLDRRRQQVQVEGIFNGDGPGTILSHYLFTWTNRRNYTLVDRAYEMQGGNVLYHKKVMTIDDLYAMVGSFNMGRKSAYCDHECAVFFKDRRVCQLLNQMLEQDKRHCHHRADIADIRNSLWTYLKGDLIIGLLGNFYG